MFKDQSQTVSDGATAVQAAGSVLIVNNSGVTYDQVRQIALDVLRANMLEYAGEALQTAIARGSAITDSFLEKLQAQYPKGMSQAREPDFQDALFNVQKAHSKAGDEDLGDLLVDLLVDRTKQEKRNALQLVLNESLLTAPKLTNGQINVLSAIFMLAYVGLNRVSTVDLLAQELSRHLAHVVGEFPTSHSTFQHLQFCGCGSQSVVQSDLGHVLREQYCGLFTEGLDRERIALAQFSSSLAHRLFIPCLNDNAKLQVSAINRAVLEELLAGASFGLLPNEDKEKLRALQQEALMNSDQVRDKILSKAPNLTPFFDRWSKSGMSSFKLTSVGMAIGHANIKRIAGEFAPLSIWINETT